MVPSPREPGSEAWNWWKTTRLSAVAGYTATGIVTRPKLMVPIHKAVSIHLYRRPDLRRSELTCVGAHDRLAQRLWRLPAHRDTRNLARRYPDGRRVLTRPTESQRPLWTASIRAARHRPSGHAPISMESHQTTFSIAFERVLVWSALCVPGRAVCRRSRGAPAEAAALRRTEIETNILCRLRDNRTCMGHCSARSGYGATANVGTNVTAVTAKTTGMGGVVGVAQL